MIRINLLPTLIKSSDFPVWINLDFVRITSNSLFHRSTPSPKYLQDDATSRWTVFTTPSPTLWVNNVTFRSLIICCRSTERTIAPVLSSPSSLGQYSLGHFRLLVYHNQEAEAQAALPVVGALFAYETRRPQLVSVEKYSRSADVLQWVDV